MRTLIVGLVVLGALGWIGAAWSLPRATSDDITGLSTVMERSRLAYETYVLRSHERAPVDLIVCQRCAEEARPATQPRQVAARQNAMWPTRLSWVKIAKLKRLANRLLVREPSLPRRPLLRGGLDLAARS